MSEQALDLRRSAQVVRKHPAIVGGVAALGLAAGIAYSVLQPPLLTSQALVVLGQSTHDISTQVVIAGSDAVLKSALPDVRPATTLDTLRNDVTVKSLTSGIISISARGPTGVDAQDTANAVAQSYLSYVTRKNSPVGTVQAKLVGLALPGTGTPLVLRLLITAVLGALVGALLGIISVLAIFRGDRRLRERDEIADSIGVSVLASIPVMHPSGPAGWTKLLEEYEPSSVPAWRLRTALSYLGLPGDLASRPPGRGGFSVTMLSLSSDKAALALGPQLATFAAAQGIPTALVIGPQQDNDATATLRAACAAAEQGRARHGLRLAVADNDAGFRLPDGLLTVVVAVVDDRAPRVPDTMRTSATLIGVSAGAATADQLAKVAASAATDGRQITGILVADPDPTDHTTGRIPQLARPDAAGPARLTGTTRPTSNARPPAAPDRSGAPAAQAGQPPQPPRAAGETGRRPAPDGQGADRQTTQARK
jgi:capsular polysaccharide biosynthesis protein